MIQSIYHFHSKEGINMNKIYKVIWSKAKHTYVVASEIAKGHTKGETTGRGLKKLAAAMLVAAALMGPNFAWAEEAVTTKVEPAPDGSAAVEVYTKDGAENAFATIENVSTIGHTVNTLSSELSTLSSLVNTLQSSTAKVDADGKVAKAVAADSAELATKAEQDGAGNVIISTYATKTEVSQKADASAVTDEASAREAGDKTLNDRITAVKEYVLKETGDNYVSKTDAAVQDAGVVKTDKKIGENVTALGKGLYDETAARIGADAAQDKVIQAVNNNLVQSVTTINKNVADGFTALNQADAKEAEAREAKDNELNERITNEANAIHDEIKAGDKVLDDRITNVKEYLEKQTSDNYVSKADAAVQDGAVVKAANTIGENVTNLDAALAKETAARIGADKAQDKVIEQVNQNMVDGFNTINKNMSDGFTALSQADANELAGRMAADTKLVEATNGGLSLDNDNVLQKTKTKISSTGEVTTSKEAATTLILNKGAANQVKIDSEGVTVGTSSTQMDAEGFTAGGHDYDAAGAALMSDGRIKGANGDFTVDENGNVASKATITGETVTDGKGASMSNGTVTGKTLTDGIATITNGNINTSGSITGSTVTSTGNISALGDIHAGGAITGASASIQGALTAGSATITGDLTAGGAIQGKSISDGTATMQNGNLTGVKNLSAETITTSGDATIGGDLTVKGKLNVDEIDLTKSGIVGDNNVTASTKVAAGEITSYKKATSTKDGSEKESSFDYDENGTSTWAKATDADGNWNKSTLTVEGSDVTSKVIDSEKNSNLSTQTSTQSQSTLTDKDKNTNVSTQTVSESSSVVSGKDGGNNYKSYITQNLKKILQKIEDGDGHVLTSTEQTETDITNTAKNGTITNDAGKLVNTASDTIANMAGNDITNTSTNGNIANTAANGTISNNAKYLTNTASENITNKAENGNISNIASNGTISNEAKTISNKADEALTNDAKTITNTASESVTTQIGDGSEVQSVMNGGGIANKATGKSITNDAATITNTGTTSVTNQVGKNKVLVDTTHVQSAFGDTIYTTWDANGITNNAADKTVATNAKNIQNTATGDITNTAEKGTITNKAQNLVNDASGNMTNTVGGNLIDTIMGTSTTTVTGKVTEDYKSDLSTKVGGDETHAVTGNQTTTVSGDRTVNVKGTETENFNALETNVKTDQKTSVGGNQTTIVTGNQTNNVSGSKTETVKGSVTEKYGSQATTVDGDQSTNIGGSQTTVVAKDQTNTVSGNKTETVKGAVNETYGSQTTKVNGNQSNTVKGTLTETVTGDVTEDYKANLSTTVGGNQTTTVTGDSSLSAKNITNTATEKLYNSAAEIENSASESITDKVGDNVERTMTTKKISESVKDGTNSNSFSKTAEKDINIITDGTTTSTLSQLADSVNTSLKNGTQSLNNTKNVTEDVTKVTNENTGAFSSSSQKADSITSAVKDTKKGTISERSQTGSQVQDKVGTTTVTTTDGLTKLTNEAGTHNTQMDFAEVLKDLGVRGNAVVDGTSTLKGDVTMESNASVGKNLTVKGDTTMEGNASVGKDLTVTGKSTLTGDVTMESNATVEKNLTVNGQSTFNDKVTITNGGLAVTGGTTTDTLHVTSTSQFDGKATFKDIVTMEKDLNVGGNAKVAGDVTAKSFKVGDKTYIDGNGINANDQVIRNVGKGDISEGSTDAVSGGQLYETNTRVSGLETRMGTVETRVDKLDNKIDKVGANAAAMANLHPLEFDEDSKWNVAAAVGSSGSETASAVGVFYRPNENVMVNASAAMGTGENMFGGGVSLRLGHGGNKAKEAQMKAAAAENKELRAKVDDLTARMDALLSVLNPNMSKDFPDVPENHWAYEAVSRLAGNGIVEGYEDGKYHGERQMTRYEMAEIIYNALSKGAKAEKKLVEEFRPELQAMAAQKKA